MKLPIVFDEKNTPIWESTRELRLRYRIGITNLLEFFNGLKEGKVLGTRCKKCGVKYFPPQKNCSFCGGDIEWYNVASNGRLITYTKIIVKPASFEKYPDYLVGIAKMEDGTNIIAWIEAELKELRVGLPVRLIVNSEKEPYWMLVPLEKI